MPATSVGVPIPSLLLDLFHFQARVSYRNKILSCACARIDLPPVMTVDVEAAIATTKPSAATMRAKFLDWQKNFESV
jgi:hypothetical protein